MILTNLLYFSSILFLAIVSRSHFLLSSSSLCAISSMQCDIVATIPAVVALKVIASPLKSNVFTPCCFRASWDTVERMQIHWLHVPSTTYDKTKFEKPVEDMLTFLSLTLLNMSGINSKVEATFIFMLHAVFILGHLNKSVANWLWKRTEKEPLEMNILGWWGCEWTFWSSKFPVFGKSAHASK